MITVTASRYALSIGVAAAFLTSCGGSQPPIGAPGAMPQTSAFATHADRGTSWMRPEAKGQDLLYWSSNGSSVRVYRYWVRKRVGTLTGFSETWGMCVDPAQDVYIVDYKAEKIIEYAHGEPKRMRVVDDSPYQPVGCAVNPDNGDLAIANHQTGPSGTGNIAIYREAKGKPTLYQDPNLMGYSSCAYDRDGNLLTTDGFYSDSGYGSDFAYLAKDSKRLVTLYATGGSSWDGGFDGVGGIAWDGKFFVLDTNSYGGSYQVTVSGRKLRYAGETYLDRADHPGPIAIYNKAQEGQGTQVIAGWYSGSEDIVGYWKYPSGGEPIAQIISYGAFIPVGLAVSLKPSLLTRD